MVWFGLFGPCSFGSVMSGQSWLGKVRHVVLCCVMVWFGSHDRAGSGLVRPSTVWFGSRGLVGFGLVRHGTVWSTIEAAI